MNDEIRDLLVRLLTEWDDGARTTDDLAPLMEEVRGQLLADADRRKLLDQCIPTERLTESDEFRAAARRAERSHMAYDLFRSLVSGSWTAALGPGNSTDKLRQWCWDQADKFLADGDKQTP